VCEGTEGHPVGVRPTERSRRLTGLWLPAYSRSTISLFACTERYRHELGVMREDQGEQIRLDSVMSKLCVLTEINRVSLVLRMLCVLTEINRVSLVLSTLCVLIEINRVSLVLKHTASQSRGYKRPY
jgi:hypothetical protein